jgi:L-alanine-DL-glutamate epimerase-like enolase superfamily enzyme
VKIERIEAIPYAIPYTHPLKFASGEVETADHVLIRIYGDDGLVGTADAPPRPFTYGETQDSIMSIVEKVFAPQLVGLDLMDRGKAHGVMGRTVNNQVAKGAVDIALWDLIGKSVGTPVHKLASSTASPLSSSRSGGAPSLWTSRRATCCAKVSGRMWNCTWTRTAAGPPMRHWKSCGAPRGSD